MSTQLLDPLLDEPRVRERPLTFERIREPSAQKAERVLDAFLARLARMSTEQRIEAARSGRFTRWERSVWSARFPDEVPLINGEFEWIALSAE